jgi:hypothetical protein
MQHAQSVPDAARFFAQIFSLHILHAIQSLGVAEQGFSALQILLPPICDLP